MNKKVGYIIYALILVVINFRAISQYQSNKTKKENMKTQIEILENKLSLTEEQIEKYDKYIKKLETDFEQEKIARNKLKMVKKNEVIYKLIETEEEK